MYVNFMHDIINDCCVDGKALDLAIISFEYYEAGDLRKAFEYANRSIERSPYYALAYCRRAKIYFDWGMYDLAVKDYSRAIDLYYRDGIYYYYRGMSYLHLRKYEEALKDFDTAIEFLPHVGVIYHTRGKTREYFSMYEEAQEDFRMACSLGDEDACFEIKK